MKPERWQKVKRICEGALECEAGEREAFLAKACAGDDQLRREVDSFLSGGAGKDGFIEAPAIEIAAKEMAEDEVTADLSGEAFLHYRIMEKIGAGGMGEVYRARDDRLKRDVAIKILPEEFAKDADRVARFQREAKLLASLNHPNIAAIHGLEESGGTQFLVLELVEGDTLAEQLKRGPIPVEESLKLALQIAEALEAAHEKGVIHRDLKPANIKVTPEGKVKVLDFGLAKALAAEQQEATLTYSPTLSELATQKGVILGTAAYMSPEQAKGRTVDKRTDIWAFGVVLYEMLTGRQLFAADTVLDTLAGVLKNEPDWAKIPARVRPLLRRCLQKDPNKRLWDIRDVKIELEEALANPIDILVQPITPVEPRTKLRMMLPWLVTAVVLVAIITGIAVWKLKSPEPRQVMSFEYNLPGGQQFSDLGYPALAVSPDGKQLVYSTVNGLYLRSFDKLTAKLIAGTEGNTTNPFFSPDGKWIGYFSASDSKLKKIAVNGGAPVVLCDVFNLCGAWWDEDNTIAYTQTHADIMRISGNGGTPESIVKLKSETMSSPQILPGEKSILYTSRPDLEQNKILVQSPKSGETTELFAGVCARYLPTGHLIYMLPSNSNLFAIPFNPYRLEVTGEPVLIVEGVRQYAISDSGTLVYIPETSSEAKSRRTLVWVNREGKEEPLSAPPDYYYRLSISPDGKRVALQVSAQRKNISNIWIWDAVRETLTRLTLDEDSHSTPLWTLDGKRIVYNLSRENQFFLGDIYWRAADGTGEGEKLASSPGRVFFPGSWSRDGKNLVFWELAMAPPQAGIGLLSMEGDHVMKPLLKEKYWEKDPRISHDGRWIAYASNETRKYEVYVRPFPDVNKGRWQVSTGGGNTPLWSPDDRELFYRSGNEAMAVPVEAEPTFKHGKATVLFRAAFGAAFAERRGSDSADYTYWDISPDGKRFLMVKDATAEAPRKINVVVNWTEELKQRVPVK